MKRIILIVSLLLLFTVSCGKSKVFSVDVDGKGEIPNFELKDLNGKKTESKNLDSSVYESEVYYYTKNRNYKIRVSEDYLNKKDKILIIDDFLANGSAALGLIELIKCAGAEVVGVGIVIEKAFQNGGEKLREDGINLHSLVRVAFDNGEIIFV